MIFTHTEIPDVIHIQPKIYGDHRGYFFESYHQKLFKENGIDVEFVQDNQSFSQKNVLRGLHFQRPPFAQGKLVRVVSGSVLDVAVDIRRGSPTYGKHITAVLSAELQNMLWIPAGFAHGFLTLEDQTIFQYKCTNYYHKESEEILRWNDPHLAINWQIEQPIVSEKDAIGVLFENLNNHFIYDGPH